MIGRLIKIYIESILFFRYWFWKIIVHFAGGKIGKRVRIYDHVKLITRKGRPLFIGDNVSILCGVVISTSESGRFTIGNNVYIGEYSVLSSNEEIIIEDYVLIGPHTNIVDFDHIFDDVNLKISLNKYKTKKVIIKKGAWLGCNCCILKGVTIGEGAIIGAGSVVTQDIPSYCIAVGNPAKVIKRLINDNK